MLLPFLPVEVVDFETHSRIYSFKQRLEEFRVRT